MSIKYHGSPFNTEVAFALLTQRPLVVIFFENGARACLVGNSWISLDTYIIVTAWGTHGVNGYYIEI